MARSFLSRRTFLKGTAGLSILAAGLYLLPGTSFFRRAQNSAHTLLGNAKAWFLRQIITKDPATTRRIMWQSDTLLENAAVEYRVAGSDTSQQTAA